VRARLLPSIPARAWALQVPELVRDATNALAARFLRGAIAPALTGGAYHVPPEPGGFAMNRMRAVPEDIGTAVPEAAE
jgi:hypothetical protein